VDQEGANEKILHLIDVCFAPIIFAIAVRLKDNVHGRL
jgi:hypothetical protein